MSLQDELKATVQQILRTRWAMRDGTVVPDTDNVQFGNDAVKLEAVVLYADLADSTRLVNQYPPEFAAEVYKSYLHCAAKIIKSEDGVITAFDGDRIMAVYIHNSKNTAAARTALKINFAVTKIINPLIASVYPQHTYRVRQVVGVDSSPLFAARTGIRGSNDLVWVGNAANIAAKMSAFNEEGYPSWITERVYASMRDEVKIHQGNTMWEQRRWNDQNLNVYCSNWTWPV